MLNGSEPVYPFDFLPARTFGTACTRSFGLVESRVRMLGMNTDEILEDIARSLQVLSGRNTAATPAPAEVKTSPPKMTYIEPSEDAVVAHLQAWVAGHPERLPIAVSTLAKEASRAVMGARDVRGVAAAFLRSPAAEEIFKMRKGRTKGSRVVEGLRQAQGA